MRALLPLLLLCLLPSCETTRAWFVPREKVDALSPGGDDAASYDVVFDTGAPVGEVKIWSEGSRREDLEGQQRTTLHVGFELDNTGDRPLTLDLGALRIEDFETGGAKIEDHVYEGERRTAAVAPQSVHRHDIVFVLPEGTAPDDLQAFRVRWRVLRGSEEFRQSTPFRRYHPARPPAYYHGGFYHPYPYGWYFGGSYWYCW